MREHDRSESHDLFAYRDAGWQRGRGAPGRMPVTAHLAPRPASAGAGASAESATVMREAEPASAAPHQPHEDPFGMHLACDALDHAAAGSSTALPEALREQFGQSLGKDLSDVRLHTDERAADAARAFSAKALTVGNDIYFAAGAYDPSSSSGQHLLAHEVAHTAQQSAAPASSSSGALSVSSPGDACEVEADRAAEAMLTGAPADFSPTASVGRVVMRSPDDGAGGAHSWDLEEQAEREEARYGHTGTETQTAAGDQQRHAEEDQRAATRTSLEGQEVNWLAAAGPGAPVDFENHAAIDAESRACPAPTVDVTAGPEWYKAFAGSWAEVEGIYGGVVPHVQVFMEAARRAEQLHLSSDRNNPQTEGWYPPKNRGNGLQRYAEEQGANDEHSIENMFPGGKLDPKYRGLDRKSAGFDDADQEAVQQAVKERSSALLVVADANTQLELLTATTARTRPIEVKGKDIFVEKAQLSTDLETKKAQLEELTRARDMMNAQLEAALSVLDGVSAVMKVRNAKAGAKGEAAGEAVKPVATAASNLISLEYNSEINQIMSAMGKVQVKLSSTDLQLAILEKEKAVTEYKGWLKSELSAKNGAVREAHGQYKKAHEAVATALRKAAVNKEKAAQKRRDAAAPPAKDKSKMTEAERAKAVEQADADEAAQAAAGAHAEAPLRALTVIDAVRAKADAGAAACREPSYSRASGIGYTMAGKPAEISARVTAIRGYRAGFHKASERWKERSEALADIVNSHAL